MNHDENSRRTLFGKKHYGIKQKRIWVW